MSTVTETITQSSTVLQIHGEAINGESGTATFNNLIRPDLHDYTEAQNLAFNVKVKQLIAEGRPIYHFAFGQSPFPIADHFKEALREYAGVTEYLPTNGLLSLRKEIVKFHQKYDNLTFDPSQITVGSGSKELILLMITVFNGDVLLLSPSWTTYYPQTKLAHHKSHFIATTQENEWRLTPDLLEEAIQKNNITGNKVLILCNPCNPTGTVYSKKELQDLSVTLRKHNIIVISDEIYSRLHYAQEHESIAKYYPEGTIVSTGMSKWPSAGGWRVGYHIYPKELKALQSTIISAGSHSYSCAPAPQQYAVAKALANEEACQSYMLHVSRILCEVAKFCVKELREEGVIVTPSHAGYYIFPNFEILRPALKKRGITTGSQMCDAMFEEANIALRPGGPDHLRPNEELTVRLCYVCFDGTDGLNESRKIGLDIPLPDGFVIQYCKPIHDGIKAMRSWVKSQMEA